MVSIQLNVNSALPSIKAYVNAALGFLYPELCQLCREERATPADGFVCANCRAGVRFIVAPFCDRCGLPFDGAITTRFECANCRELELHFCSARSAVIAKGAVLDAIHRYKYQRALWFEPFLAGLFIRQAASELKSGRWDLITPVPLHPAKLREREFNQARRLATRLGAEVDLPVDAQMLQRTVPTRTQTLLTREQRAANVRNAFSMRDGRRLNGERVVLVDDVFTTGATTSACAKVLRKAGAGEVCVWTLARGL
jgi:ComF family protein